MALTRNELARATEVDEQWMAKSPDKWPAGLDGFKRVADDISQAEDGVMLRGNRNLVPSESFSSPIAATR